MNVRLLKLSVATSIFALATPAFAQQTPEPDPSQDIVVTAQKRSERLQDVPISVTAVDAGDLVDQNLLSIRDFATRIPGITVNAATNRTNGIAIRGVTTGGGGNPTVAILIDDIPFGGSGYAALAPLPDIDPSDLKQIEVLRGPQGVLYGASNLGGLVKYETRTADTKDLSGRFELGGSTVAHGDEGYQARGAINIPIVTDKLGFRISGYYRSDPGFIDNTLTGKSDTNSAETFGGRASLFFKPTDRLSINASALYQKLNGRELGFAELGPDYQPATSALGAGFTGRPLAHAIGTSHNKTIQRLYSLRIDYDLDFATLTALTGYGQSRFDQVQDTTARFNGLLQLFGYPPNTPSTLSDQSRTNKFSQEIRLASKDGGNLEWMLGGFYTRETSQLNQQVDAFPGGALTNLYSILGPNRYEEVAGFANATYKFSSAFDIQVGGRYAHNKQQVIQDANGPLNGGPSYNAGTSSEDAFTWLVTPRLRLNGDTMIYARVATGYRPGGPNTILPGIPATFNSDSTINYEIGAKGSLFDRVVAFDLSAYYIDWKDIQLLLTANSGFQYFANGRRAQSYGLEGSVTVRPATGTTISGNFSWGRADLRDPLLSSATATGAFGLRGDRLPYTANFSGNIAFDQKFDLGSVRPTFGGTLTYVGDREGAFSTGPTVPRMHLPAYVTLDLRTGAEFNGGWGVNIFVRNLFDRQGWSTGQLRAASSAAQGYQVYLIQPRTIGINLSKTF